MRVAVTTSLLLALCTAVVHAQEQSPEKDFDALRKEYGTAQRKFIEDYNAKIKKLKEEAEQRGEEATLPAFSFEQLSADFAPKFQAGAERYRGTDDALPFLRWLLGNTQGEQRDAVLETLLHDHIQSPAFKDAVSLIGSVMRSSGAKRSDEVLQRIIDESPSGDVKAEAWLTRASLVTSGRDVSDVDKEQALSSARKALELASDEGIKSRAEGIVFEQEHLQVGMAAPDIEGHDVDGNAFKLSDYRGKVVLLDFWGDW